MKEKDEAKKEMVKQVVSLNEQMNQLTADNVVNAAPITEPEVQELTLKQICKNEGALWIEPKRRLSAPIGKLPEKLQREHAHAWEYVKGIFENLECPGQPIEFDFCWYPGDPDLRWEIPCNKVVYVPRLIAKHLEKCMQYHKFGYVNKPVQAVSELDYMENFAVLDTLWRGKFRPVEAFA